VVGIERRPRVGPGLLVTYLSIVVVIPVLALAQHAFVGGPTAFWDAITQTEALDAVRLTVLVSFGAVVVNAVVGTAVAWVLVRDNFLGKSLLNAIIDLPFAMPTVVVGVTLVTLYGPYSPVHVDVANSWVGIVVALLFVTLPFSVRSVQPVLESMDFAAEEAAATLGSKPLRTFCSITLPSLLPSIITGAGLSLARSLGEFGSVVFISGNEPFHTELGSAYIYALSQDGQLNSAAAVSVFLLVIALVILATFGWIERRIVSRLG